MPSRTRVKDSKKREDALRGDGKSIVVFLRKISAETGGASERGKGESGDEGKGAGPAGLEKKSVVADSGLGVISRTRGRRKKCAVVHVVGFRHRPRVDVDGFF